jgi:hypothetical protein
MISSREIMRAMAIMNAMKRMRPTSRWYNMRFAPNLENLTAYRSKYEPHQGKQECARRLARAEKKP